MAAGAELKPLSLRREGDGLDVDWSDGTKTRVTWRHLRTNCPCATCNEERQKPADPFKLIGDRDPQSLGLRSVGILNLRGKRKPVTVLTLEGDVDRYETAATGEILRDRRASDRVAVEDLAGEA